MPVPDVHIAERGRPLGGPLSQWFHFRLIPFVGAQVVKLLASTLRVRREGFEPVEALVQRDSRFILAFFHRRLILMPEAYPFLRRLPGGERRGVSILSSDSKDGERSAATWRWFGIHAVRGTAGQGGAQALVKMIQAVKQGWDLGITVDGPRGPAGEVKPGVLAVSRKTGAHVVPVCVAYESAWALGTWDRMLIPKPFSTVVVRYGAPFLARNGREEADRQALAESLNGMEAWAEQVGRC